MAVTCTTSRAASRIEIYVCVRLRDEAEDLAIKMAGAFQMPARFRRT
jgi:hypothetical protein